MNELDDIFQNDGYAEEGDIIEGIVRTRCNLVFALFIYNVGKHLKGYALREVILYCCLFRKALNEKGWMILHELGLNEMSAEQNDQEFCEINGA